jgi:DNA-binding HxlR family transcriptional regulator
MLAGYPPGTRACSIAAALGILGERWSLLAVRELGYGVHRFDQIASFTGASRDILADRLRRLEAEGVVERRQYSAHPPRFEYHLTQAGRELLPILISLGQWGDRWAVDRPAVTLRHECGRKLRADLVCHHCGEVLTAEGIEPRPAAHKTTSDVHSGGGLRASGPS